MPLGLREIVRRMGYHPATSETVSVFEEIRHRFIELALWMDENLPEGREKAEMQTQLEYAEFNAIGAVARNTGPGTDPLPNRMPPGYGERGDWLPPGAMTG
jgi:hypothetical protein